MGLVGNLSRREAQHRRSPGSRTQDIAKQLAEEMHLNEPALYRLLRALASVGVFHEERAGCSARPLFPIRCAAMPAMPAKRGHDVDRHLARERLGELHGLSRPDVAPPRRSSVCICSSLSTHPDQAVNFNNAMADLSSGDGPAVLASYDFSRFERIVEIGGGSGALLAAILSAPRLQGILFDMPYVIEQAKTAPMLKGFAGRWICRRQFFDTVPGERTLTS